MTQGAFDTLYCDEGKMSHAWWQADDPLGICYIVYLLREDDTGNVGMSLYAGTQWISPATSIAVPATLDPAKSYLLGISSAWGLTKYVLLLL